METEYLEIVFMDNKKIVYSVGNTMGINGKLIKKIEVDTNKRIVKFSNIEYNEYAKSNTSFIVYPFENIIALKCFEQSGRS